MKLQYTFSFILVIKFLNTSGILHTLTKTGHYYVVPWKELVSMESELSQDEVAAYLTVDACRISELHKFGFLIPLNEGYKPLKYKASNVHNLKSDPQIREWIKQCNQAKKKKSKS